jgi:hypothetical protein
VPVPPWQRLLDAQMEALEAARGDDLARQKAAIAELNQAREECACVGGLLILLAIEHGGLVVQKKLGKVFGGLARGAWEKAAAAQARATEALEQLDAMKQQLKELEKKVVGARHPSRIG